MSRQDAVQQSETDLHYNQRVIYAIPTMEQARVRKNITYKTIEDTHLKLDVYYPADARPHIPLPAVVLIHGDGPVKRLATIKDSGQYVSWGQLLAASGLIAITANHRSTEELRNVVGVANDVDDLITYIRENSATLHIDSDMLCIWTCSAGTPFALRTAINEVPPYIKAIVCYYGFTELKALYEEMYGAHNPDNDPFHNTPDSSRPLFTEEDFAEFSATDLLLHRPAAIAPLFIARAGLDFATLNSALDNFIAEAIDQNCAITVMNHPTGRHGFDIRDANARSEEIIVASLEFIRTHLLK
jgi:acetyl esterase/lipase